MKGTIVVSVGSGAPPLDIEVSWVTERSGCNHINCHFRGRGVFVSVQQSNNNMLHTNQNCKKVQYSTKSICNMIILQSTTKGVYNENVPRKNSQKTAEIVIEYPLPTEHN